MAGALDRALARAPLWRVGRWGQAQFGAEATLARTLLAAVRAPVGTELAALIARLSREQLLVSPWVAVPDVRSKVAALRQTPAGRVVRDQVFPILCQFALRLAWDEVAPRPDMDLRRVAHELHTRTMAHLINFVADVADDPESAATIVCQAPRRDRAHLVAVSLRLKAHLGTGWRRRMATMLGTTPGALRTQRWRLRKRVTRTPDHRPGKSAV